MKELTIKALNRLNDGSLARQELTATQAGRRRWIAIYPLSTDNIPDRIKIKYPGCVYKVMDFELKIELIDEFFGEEDKEKLAEYLLSSKVELIRLLDEMGVDAGKFDAPWNNDYPL